MERRVIAANGIILILFFHLSNAVYHLIVTGELPRPLSEVETMDLVQLAQKFRTAQQQVNHCARSVSDHERGLAQAKLNQKFAITAQMAAMKNLAKKRRQITESGRVVVTNRDEVDEVFISIRDHDMRCRVVCDSGALKVYATSKGLRCRTLDEEAADIATIAPANPPN